MRKILLIGATSAIAEATARYFAAEGCAFFLVARNETKLQTIAQDLQVRGASQVDYRPLDMNEFEEHLNLIQAAHEALAGFNTVLIAHGTLGDQEASQASYATTEEELKTNFLSVVSLLTPIANQFEQQKYGTIAVISSVAGDRGRQSNYVYGTAKAATSTFLQGLRNRLYKSGVQVLTIKPGLVDTPMTAHRPKGPLFASADTVGKQIHEAIQGQKDVVYVPWFWWGIMMMIKGIPEMIFKRLSL